MSLFSALHNDNLLYLLWHSKLKVKNVPHLWLRNVLLVSSLLNGDAWQACAQQTERNHSHTNSAVSHQVFVYALLVQHIQYSSGAQPAAIWPHVAFNNEICSRAGIC